MNKILIGKKYVVCSIKPVYLSFFWAEATSLACFLVNYFLLIAINKKNLHEVWFDTLASYSDLNMFGSLASDRIQC